MTILNPQKPPKFIYFYEIKRFIDNDLEKTSGDPIFFRKNI